MSETTADKLLYTKNGVIDAWNAINEQGVLTPNKDIALMGDSIRRIEGSIVPSDSEWQPNPKWVAMPPMPPEGNQKIYCIIAVRKELPVYAVYATTSTGQYRVDWGDGGVTLHNSGVLAEYTYDYDSVISEVTDLGYKTALVTITPVTPNTLRTLNFYTSHSSDTRVNKSAPLLFMRGRIPYVTSFLVNTTIATTTAWRNSILEGLDMLDTSYLNTDLRSMLHTATSLQWFPQFDTSNVPVLYNLMINCTSLRKPPNFNMGKISGGNATNIFSGCTQIREIDELNTGSSNSASTIFSGCTNLEIIRNFICPNVASVDNTFSGCYSLRVLRVTMGSVTTSFNVSNTALNREALVELFGDLYDRTATTAGTITITGCLGASSLTAADKLIATSKNWTIVE